MQAIGPDHLTLAANPDDWYEALAEPCDAAAQRERAERNFDFLHFHRSVDGLAALGELQ